MPGLRIVFMGTPDLAATCLNRLLEKPNVFEVVAAVSQPDRPKGRQLHLLPTPVKVAAEQAAVPVLQPEKARDPAFLDTLRTYQPDLIAVAAYGQLLPQALLDIPPHGCLNVHTSLLPRYRGAAPIQWAILNGDPETGVSIMKIIPELDAGDILRQRSTPIHKSDNAQTLHDRLADLGAELLAETIPDHVAGRITPTAQRGEDVVYARKIAKADGRIDWTRPAHDLWNQVRGLAPWPGAFTHLPIGTTPLRIKLWQVEPDTPSGPPGRVLEAGGDGIVVGCGQGCLRIRELQAEGRRRMGAEAFLAGTPLKPGDNLATPSSEGQ